MGKFKGIIRHGRYRMRNGGIATLVAYNDPFNLGYNWRVAIGDSTSDDLRYDNGRKWVASQDSFDIIAGPLDELEEMAGLTGLVGG